MPFSSLNHQRQRLCKGKGSPYSIAQRRVLELIPVLGSQPAGDVSSKPDGRLPLISAMGTLGTCPGPPDFFFFLKGPQLAVVKLIFKTNYLITFAKTNCKGNPVNKFSSGVPTAPNRRPPVQAKTLLAIELHRLTQNIR